MFVAFLESALGRQCVRLLERTVGVVAALRQPASPVVARRARSARSHPTAERAHPAYDRVHRT